MISRVAKTLASCAIVALLLPDFANAHASNKNIKLDVYGKTVETIKFQKYHHSHYTFGIMLLKSTPQAPK